MNNQNYQNNQQGWDMNRSYGLAPVKPAYDHTVLLAQNELLLQAQAAAKDVPHAEATVLFSLATDFVAQLRRAVQEYACTVYGPETLPSIPEIELIGYWARSFALIRQKLLTNVRCIRAPGLLKHRILQLGRSTELICLLLEYFKYEALIQKILHSASYISADNATRDEYLTSIRRAIDGFGFVLKDDAFEDDELDLDKYGYDKIIDVFDNLFTIMYHSVGSCAIIDEYCTRVFTLIRQYWAISMLVSFAEAGKGQDYEYTCPHHIEVDDE